jgi:hypothetical protein
LKGLIGDGVFEKGQGAKLGGEHVFFGRQDDDGCAVSDTLFPLLCEALLVQVCHLRYIRKFGKSEEFEHGVAYLTSDGISAFPYI